MHNTLWQSLAAVDAVDVRDILGAALRALIIYVVTLALLRFVSKRIMSKASAFDVVVAIMLGSVMSRAINGSAALLLTVVAGAVLVGIHGLFSVLAYRTRWFGRIVKGEPVLLIKDGQVEPGAMQRAGLSAGDLAEALRLHGHLPDPAKIQLAFLERDGRISIIPRKLTPRVIEVSNDNGVPLVRIELATE